MPIILISILIAFLSNYGSVLAFIEPFTFIKIDLGSYNKGYVNFYNLERITLKDFKVKAMM